MQATQISEILQSEVVFLSEAGDNLNHTVSEVSFLSRRVGHSQTMTEVSLISHETIVSTGHMLER